MSYWWCYYQEVLLEKQYETDKIGLTLWNSRTTVEDDSDDEDNSDKESADIFVGEVSQGEANIESSEV